MSGETTSRAIPTATLIVLATVGLFACAPQARSGVIILPPCPESDPNPTTIRWEHHGRPISEDTPVVLVFHGGPGGAPPGIAGSPFWRALAREVSLILYHQRGTGLSAPLTGRAAPPESADCYRMAILAEDAEHVADELLPPHRRVFVLGVSFGAQLATLFALHNHERVAGVILVAPAADHRWISKQPRHMIRALRRLAAPSRAATRGLDRVLAGSDVCPGWQTPAAVLRLGGEYGYTRRNQARVQAALATLGDEGDSAPLCALLGPPPASRRPRGEMVEPSLSSPAQFRTVACRELGWAEVSSANCESVGPELARFDIRDRLHEIRAPALVLSSRYDPIVPPELTDEFFMLLGGPGTLVRMNTAGHLILREEPGRSLDAVRQFIGSHP